MSDQHPLDALRAGRDPEPAQHTRTVAEYRRWERRAAAAMRDLFEIQNYGIPGGYIDSDTYAVPPGHDVRFYCTFCGETWFDEGPEKHAENCLIEQFRKLLAEVQTDGD